MSRIYKKADALSQSLGIESKAGRKLIRLFIEAISDELRDGNAVELGGFGTFYAPTIPPADSKAGAGGSPVRNLVHFLPSRALERKLNTGSLSKPVEFTDERDMMHATIQLKIIHTNSAFARKVMNETFRLFKKYESSMNFYDPASELSLLNAHPGEKHQVSDELYGVLKDCCTVGERSGGAYDITIGPVVRVWDFGAEKPKVPSRQAIETLLPRVDFRAISLSDCAVAIRPGTSVDLSGAVKGFAADAGQRLFRKRGVKNGMVDAGRNIYLLGSNTEGARWRIGVAHPRKPDTLFAILHLSDEAVATSGDYERYFFENGVHYHHLLDPRTGYPTCECVSVTVVSKSAALTDMLSTAAFVLGPEKGKKLLAEMECDGLFVTRKGIEMTPGMESKIQFICDPADVIKSIAQF